MRLPTAISSSKAGSTPGNDADGICADASKLPPRSARATRAPKHANRRPAATLNPAHPNFLVIDVSLERCFLNRRQHRERLARDAAVPMHLRVQFPPQPHQPATTAVHSGRTQSYRRQCRSSPSNTASTLPSRRFRTQPCRPSRLASMIDPGPVAHALHPAADQDPADGMRSSLGPEKFGDARVYVRLARHLRGQICRCEARQGLWRHSFAQRFKRLIDRSASQPKSARGLAARF